MGKSIIHCADCGKAIREDDFARGKASTVDSRSTCSDCRAVSSTVARNLDLKKSSTSRIPLSSQTPRKPFAPAALRDSRVPLLAGGAILAVVLIVLLGFALSGTRGKGRVDEQAVDSTAKSREEKQPAPKRELTASEPKPSDPVPPGAAAPQPRIDPAAKPAGAEKAAAPSRLRLIAPLEGARFRAPADIVLEAELQGSAGTVARIEFWEGKTKVGESTEAPYRFTWKSVASAGKVELKARWIDKAGAEIESSGVRITVEPAEAGVAKAPPEAPAPEPPREEPAKDKPAPAEGKAPAPKRGPVPPVDQKKVDQAIKKGVQFLVGQVGKIPPAFAKDSVKECRSDELVLWTFIHAGVSETSPVFRHLFKTMTEAELRRTYETSLQAMILEELDRVRYQGRILQCAQFLVDNQCVNGQWYYGEPVPPSKDVPTAGGLPVPTASRMSGGQRQKPPVVRQLKVTPRKTGRTEGDNSNAQYAALGIRACVDAGIAFPDETLQRARKWFRGSQHSAVPGADPGVATGTEMDAPPAGWCYGSKNHGGHGAYGSMTAGAIGALAIYDTLLGEDWRKDPAVASGLSWMAGKFTVEGNPGPPSETFAKNDPNWCHYYYLYALERAGVLCRTEWIGRHAWYSEGVGYLLASQDRDGSWEGWLNTCFAILFLKRATRPLEDVASMDDKSRK